MNLREIQVCRDSIARAAAGIASSRPGSITEETYLSWLKNAVDALAFEHSKLKTSSQRVAVMQAAAAEEEP